MPGSNELNTKSRTPTIANEAAASGNGAAALTFQPLSFNYPIPDRDTEDIDNMTKPVTRRRRAAPLKKKRPSAPEEAAVADEHLPTPLSRQQVESLSGMGIPQDQIALLIGCGSGSTLRRHYRNELNLGLAKANNSVVATLYGIATDRKHPKSAAAAIFWTKARMGWKDRSTVEHTGPGGQPLPVGERTRVIVLPDNGRNPDLMAQNGKGEAAKVAKPNGHSGNGSAKH